MNLRNLLSILLVVKSSLSFTLPSSHRLTRKNDQESQVRVGLPKYTLPSTALFQLEDESELNNAGTETETAKEKKGDGSKITERIAKIYDNLNSGEFGKRGEAYFVLQAALVLCILYGNIPLLGDVITFVLGPCLAVAGCAVIVLGLKELGTNLSPWPAATEDSSLVKEGIYGELRHPIYAGLLYLCLGVSIWSGSAMRVLLTGALWYLLEKKCNFEEKMLVEKFDEYEDYQLDVGGKFVPERLVEAMPWVDSD